MVAAQRAAGEIFAQHHTEAIERSCVPNHPNAISLGDDQNNPILAPITLGTLTTTEPKRRRGFSVYINNGPSESGRPSAVGKVQEKFKLRA